MLHRMVAGVLVRWGEGQGESRLLAGGVVTAQARWGGQGAGGWLHRKPPGGRASVFTIAVSPVLRKVPGTQ